MAAAPEIPSDKAELARAISVYADLITIYPDNEGYLQQYAELLLADEQLTTATEALKQLHDLTARHAPDKAAALARKYPQIGRVNQTPGGGDVQELGRELRNEFGAIWLRLHQDSLIEGQHLYRQGDPGDSLYLILSGEVAVYQQLEGGRHTVVDIIGSNDVIGEEAFLSPGVRRADIVANRKTSYVELPRKRLLTWLLEHPDIERLLEYKANFRLMLSLISCSRLLQTAPLEMRKYMAEQSQMVRYRAGNLIHQAGEELAYVDMLVHGDAQLAVRPSADSPRLIKLEHIRIGELIGDTSAVRKASCPADILAITDVLMAHIPLSAFTNVVSAYPPLREKLITHADAQQRRIMRQILAQSSRNKQ